MNHLIVLLKNPIIGKAKTRIAARVGDEKALAVYSELLMHLKALLQSLQNVNIHLFFSDNLTDTTPFSGLYKNHIQSGEDLGERMLNAAIKIKSLGDNPKIVIIGSDCPYIKDTHITEAFSSLDTHDLTFGQALDGGYYLIGFQRIIPTLFNNITWSTDHVLDDSLSIASQHGLRYYLTPVLSDVDSYDDYLAWKTSNNSGNDSL